jgi:hypothetical protein
MAEQQQEEQRGTIQTWTAAVEAHVAVKRLSVVTDAVDSLLAVVASASANGGGGAEAAAVRAWGDFLPSACLVYAWGDGERASDHMVASCVTLPTLRSQHQCLGLLLRSKPNNTLV